MNGRLSKCVVTILAIVMLVLGITPATGQEGPAQVGLRPDAPPYALHGPYWVGARDFVIDPDSERPLTVTVWYPALNPEGLPEEAVYQIADANLLRVFFPDNTDWSIRGHAIQDADPDAASGPYPLVLFSPGSGVWRQISPYLVEHLASYGFVVVAMDHLGEGITAEMFWQGYIQRPKDIRRTIDYASSLTASGGALENSIDVDHVGITGVSLGGYTALAAAGAQIDWPSLMTWCTEHPEGDPGAVCPALREHGEEMATLAGLSALPDGLWPGMRDERIDAAVSFAGGAFLFGPTGMQSLSVPLLTIGQSGDQVLPADWNIYVTHENASSARKALAVLAGSNHFMFDDACDVTPWMTNIGLFYVCSDPVWDMDRAHDLVNHFTTAFLLAELKDDAEAAAALAPDAVQFPGITYEAQGF